MVFNENKPCLIEARQGFSVLYNQKYLYSKYNPSKAVEQIISNQTFLPGSIILCISPVLEYGIQELLTKLSEINGKFLLILCEKDKNLFDFMLEHNKYAAVKNITDNISIFAPGEKCMNELPLLLGKKHFAFENFTFNTYDYKRIIRIDFSAGSTLFLNYYNQLENACINSIKSFWINRMTLVKFGRMYSTNLFKNISNLKFSQKADFFFSFIDKPIIVCGAGESLIQGIQDFKENHNEYFIICVDTALPFLLKNDIEPDIVFIEESQPVILKAFIGNIKNYNFKIFMSLTAAATLSHQNIDKSRLIYYFPEYSEESFISELKEKTFFPETNTPFGSVGLTALYYATKLRNSDNTPVFLYGLDFSFSAGLTHTKEAIAPFLKKLNSNRLHSLYNFDACYNKYASKFADSNSKILYTTPTLFRYAELLNYYFEKTPCIYNSADSGLKLNLPYKKPGTFTRHSATEQNIKNNAKTNSNSDNTKINSNDNLISEAKQHEIFEYFTNKKNELLELKNLLTNKNIELNTEERNFKVKEICTKNEYLFLHFPDGFNFSLSIDFLKRIRNEIDFFEKVFDLCLTN